MPMPGLHEPHLVPAGNAGVYEEEIHQWLDGNWDDFDGHRRGGIKSWLARYGPTSRPSNPQQGTRNFVK
jgi:hypothetical protein